MKRAVVAAMVCFCLFLGAKPVELSASIILNYEAGWNDTYKPFVGAAVTAWTNRLIMPQQITLNFGLAELGGSTLGQTRDLAYYNNHQLNPSAWVGLPAQADITIDTGAWISWNLNSPVNEKYDALSILTHEVGHAIGFASVFSPFMSQVTYTSGNPYIDGYRLYSTNNLSHMYDSNDLMNPYITAGIRSSPSDADIDILHIAYGYQPVPLPATLLLFGPALAGFAILRRRFAA